MSEDELNKLLRDTIVALDASKTAREAAEARADRRAIENRHLRQRLADALRLIASIADQIRCDSPVQSQHCEECAEQMSDTELLSEGIRCEACESVRRDETSAQDAEDRAVDAAVEKDQARRHGEVIE